MEFSSCKHYVRETKKPGRDLSPTRFVFRNGLTAYFTSISLWVDWKLPDNTLAKYIPVGRSLPPN